MAIVTKISGIGNTKEPVLICIEKNGETTATDVEVSTVTFFNDGHDRGTLEASYASLTFVFDDDVRGVSVNLYTGEACPDSKVLVPVDGRVFFERDELNRLRRQIGGMLDLRPIATLDSGKFFLMDGEGNELNSDLSRKDGAS